jgi:hypothetical protein
MEYCRQLAPDRPVRERIRDWDDFHTSLTLEELQEQSARCMDCGRHSAKWASCWAGSPPAVRSIT